MVDTKERPGFKFDRTLTLSINGHGCSYCFNQFTIATPTAASKTEEDGWSFFFTLLLWHKIENGNIKGRHHTLIDKRPFLLVLFDNFEIKWVNAELYPCWGAR